MILFFALCFVGVAIAGLTAFIIFWPLTLIHIRDRHPALSREFGDGAFIKPRVLSWLLCNQYRQQSDKNLNGLATPAKISLLVIFAGLFAAFILWLFSMI